MSETIVLEVSERTELGKAARKLRQEGILPANIYERGQQSIAVKVPSNVMTKIYHQAGKNHPIELHVGNAKKLAMIKDVDIDPVKHTLRHVAFHAVNKNETVEAEVPVKLTEDIPAERASLMVLTPTDIVTVEAKPGNLPEEFLVDASVLVEVGDRITVADLKVPADVVITSDPDLVIAYVEEPKDQIAAAAAEAAETEELGDNPEANVDAEKGAVENTEE
jgi:large subunit ribosomal protein L25